jgi:hypothetical protein
VNGLRAQSEISPVVGLRTSASGQAYFGMAFTPFLMKQLYFCGSVVIASFVGTGMWPQECEDDCCVGEAMVLHVTAPCIPLKH